MTGADTAKVTLRNDSTVRVERRFRAPVTRIYEAHTAPELVRRWLLGPQGWTMPVCEMDVRSGGKYRWRWKSESGEQEFGFHGEYLEVSPPARIVAIEYFDPGNVEADTGDGCRVVTEFSETDGITTLTVTMDFGTREARDSAMGTGMTDGMESSYKRLDGLLVDIG